MVQLMLSCQLQERTRTNNNKAAKLSGATFAPQPWRDFSVDNPNAEQTPRSRCPIQRAISRLKTFAGMPVPAFIKWVDGKPNFRQIDEQQYMRHYQYRLCAICGTKLGLSCYWLGGEACMASHEFINGAMHRECAELSIRWCPFLNKTKPTYRGDLKGAPMQDMSGRPDRMYLLRGVTSEIVMEREPNWVGFHAGKQLTVVREF